MKKDGDVDFKIYNYILSKSLDNPTSTDVRNPSKVRNILFIYVLQLQATFPLFTLLIDLLPGGWTLT